MNFDRKSFRWAMCVKPALLQRGFFCFRSSQLEVWGQICWSIFFTELASFFSRARARACPPAPVKPRLRQKASTPAPSHITGKKAADEGKGGGSGFVEEGAMLLLGRIFWGGGSAGTRSLCLPPTKRLIEFAQKRLWMILRYSLLAHLAFDWSENHIPTKSILSKNFFAYLSPNWKGWEQHVCHVWSGWKYFFALSTINTITAIITTTTAETYHRGHGMLNEVPGDSLSSNYWELWLEMQPTYSILYLHTYLYDSQNVCLVEVIEKKDCENVDLTDFYQHQHHCITASASTPSTSSVL